MKLLLVITGSIAAYKTPELVRLLTQQGVQTDVILTAGAQHFVTPLTLSALTGRPCYSDLFSLKDETDMGHIRLAREADVIAVAPASADFIAKLAQGRADDLASACLLAATQKLILAPAMNPAMLAQPATQENLNTLRHRGHTLLAGEAGQMACGETGEGRMAEPQALADYLLARLELQQLTIAADALSGRHIVITAGPTREAIDPVRFISNHSSGKQGYALASCLAAAGASVTLISGPTALPAAAGVTRISVTSARDMAQAVSTALPADVAICAAAVSDWQVGTPADTKLKKQDGGFAPQWEASPDILHMLGHSPQRPPLLIGFAAETGDIGPKAREKCQRKNCDLVITNDVSGGRIFGEDETEIAICTPDGCETLAPGSKRHISAIITQRITEALT